MFKILPVILSSLFLTILSDSCSSYELDKCGIKVYLHKEKFFYFIMTVMLAVKVGLRTRGNDTATYRYAYEMLATGRQGLQSINWFNISRAPGLQLWEVTLKTIGASTQDYLMLIALFTISVYLWFIRKYTCNIKLSVFYFITMGVYGFTMAAIKQTTAVAFLMIATDCAIKHKWKKFVFWVFIAELFHPYSFIYLIIFFLQFSPWSKRTYILLFSSAIVSIVLTRLMNIIDAITGTLGYNYSDNSFTGEGVNVFRVLVVWVPLVLSFLVRDKLCKSDDMVMNIAINLMMVNAVVMFIGLFGTANYFARLANYFLIFQVIALPLIIGLLNQNDKYIISFMSVICFSAYYIYEAGILRGGIDANYSFMPLSEYLGGLL